MSGSRGDRTSGLPLIEFPAEPLEWERVFVRRQPVELEIGCGKGMFLIRAAESRPDVNWVGLERRWSTLSLAVERIARSGLPNALVVRCDAMEVLRLWVPAGSLSGLHVYYPDPWWKKRHEKRRVFTPAFLGDAARAVEPRGGLRVVTDVPERFAEIREAVASSGFFEPVDLPEEAWGPREEPLTSYEAKYLMRGKAPLRAAYRRSLAPAPPAEPWLSRKPRGTPLADRLPRDPR